MKDKIIEIFKTALLKQLHKVRYVINGYPIEAVPKADILALDALVGKELEALYTTEISEEDVSDEREQAVKRGGEDYADNYIEGLEDGWGIGYKAALSKSAKGVSDEVLFKKVKCSDRLPSQENDQYEELLRFTIPYHLISGSNIKTIGYYDFELNQWWVEDYPEATIEYWLEELNN